MTYALKYETELKEFTTVEKCVSDLYVKKVVYSYAIAATGTNTSGKKVDLGIVICGSGNGIAMSANKHQGVRCALCWTKEIAVLARQHNDANVISIPARFTAIPQVLEMVEAFLNTRFEGGRHANRVNKIACS